MRESRESYAGCKNYARITQEPSKMMQDDSENTIRRKLRNGRANREKLKRDARGKRETRESSNTKRKSHFFVSEYASPSHLQAKKHPSEHRHRPTDLRCIFLWHTIL